METRRAPEPPAAPATGSPVSSRDPMKVSELMGEHPVIELDHEGEIYRLRITRNRKLILTK